MPSGAVQCRPGPRPPSTDGAPRPAVGAPSTDQVGERCNSRSSGLRVRGFRGHGDLERGPGAVGSVGAGRGGVAQPVGWCNPQVASRGPMRSSHEATCGPCGGPPSLIRCLRCGRLSVGAFPPGGGGRVPCRRVPSCDRRPRRRAPVEGTSNGRHSFTHMRHCAQNAFLCRCVGGGGPTKAGAGCRMRRILSSRGRPPACSVGSGRSPVLGRARWEVGDLATGHGGGNGQTSRRYHLMDPSSRLVDDRRPRRKRTVMSRRARDARLCVLLLRLVRLVGWAL